MNANIAKVQSLIENAFTSAIEKLAKDESGNFISDLYVQADAESGELLHQLCRARYNQPFTLHLAVHIRRPVCGYGDPHAGEHVQPVVERPVERRALWRRRRTDHMPLRRKAGKILAREHVPVPVPVRAAHILRQRVEQAHILG